MDHVYRSSWLAASTLLIVGLNAAGGPLSATLAQQQTSAGRTPQVSSVALAQPAESVAVVDDHLVLAGRGARQSTSVLSRWHNG